MTKAPPPGIRAPSVTCVEWEHWVEGEGGDWNWSMQLHGATPASHLWSCTPMATSSREIISFY